MPLAFNAFGLVGLQCLWPSMPLAFNAFALNAFALNAFSLECLPPT
jgi:hypothetical protein